MGHYDEFYEAREREIADSRMKEYELISKLNTYEKVLLLRTALNGWKRDRILQEVLEELAMNKEQ